MDSNSMRNAERMIRKTRMTVFKRNIWPFDDKVVFDYEVCNLEICHHDISHEFYMSEEWYPINIIDNMMKCKQWANPEQLQILIFTSGLVRLVQFDNIKAYKQELKKINNFNMQRKTQIGKGRQQQLYKPIFAE